MVLCFHLQHPGPYSPEGLAEAEALLTEFVEHGASTDDVRRRNRSRLDSGNRKWKITGTPASHGSYSRPMQWSMTATDVIAGDVSNYCDNVRAWARSINEELKAI
jgi:hypothetical protein